MDNILITPLFNWIILPMLIFFARIIDVSMGTIRIMFIARGKRGFASILGFVEVLIWLLAIRQVFNNLNNFVCYLAYGGGFATGSYVGMWIENKLAIGMQIVRIITNRNANQLIKKLRYKGYGVTSVEGTGNNGDVHIIFTVIKRRDLAEIRSIIKKFNNKTFYSVEDVRMAADGIFPSNNFKSMNRVNRLLRFDKKK